jgi:hypothetical protein
MKVTFLVYGKRLATPMFGQFMTPDFSTTYPIAQA